MRVDMSRLLRLSGILIKINNLRCRKTFLKYGFYGKLFRNNGLVKMKVKNATNTE